VSNNNKFSLVAVGDCLIFQRLSVFNEPGFLKVLEIIKGGDVAFANFETLINNNKGFPRYKMDVSGWMTSPKYVLNELKWMGFNLFSLANNHVMDYGEIGLLENLRVFEEEGVTYAGAGRMLTEARSPAYLNTPKARVALIALNTRGEDMPAGEPWGSIPGRPGINPLRFIKTFIVEKSDFKVLIELSKKLNLQGMEEDILDFLGHRFQVGEKTDIITVPYKPDMEGNIRSISEARRNADLVIVSIHNHEKLRLGKTYFDDYIEYIADFVENFSRAAIDAGADVVLGHGTHCLNGIEIYKGHPIFYGLGNFISQSRPHRQPYEWYEARGFHEKSHVYVDHKLLTSSPILLDSERTRARERAIMRKLSGDAEERHIRRSNTSVIANVIFNSGKIKEILLYPIELSKGTQGGRPFLASGSSAIEILNRLSRLSSTYGTNIIIENEIGKIVV
jgi:poly-gamma-glutamate synthesis protein (capsule biosynthesis protein)